LTCFTFHCWCSCHHYDYADNHSEHDNLMKSCGRCIGNHEQPIALYNMSSPIVQQEGDCHV